METHFDVIVIGGSFAGLSAAMQLARARRRVLVLDGERPRNRFAPHSHGFFGQDGKTPADIIRDATAQLLAYPTARVTMSEALAAEREAGRFVVTCADGTSASAMTCLPCRDSKPAGDIRCCIVRTAMATKSRTSNWACWRRTRFHSIRRCWFPTGDRRHGSRKASSNQLPTKPHCSKRVMCG